MNNRRASYRPEPTRRIEPRHGPARVLRCRCCVFPEFFAGSKMSKPAGQRGRERGRRRRVSAASVFFPRSGKATVIGCAPACVVCRKHTRSNMASAIRWCAGLNCTPTSSAGANLAQTSDHEAAHPDAARARHLWRRSHRAAARPRAGSSAGCFSAIASRASVSSCTISKA